MTQLTYPSTTKPSTTTYPRLIKHKHQAEQEKVSLTFRPNIRQVNML